MMMIVVFQVRLFLKKRVLFSVIFLVCMFEQTHSREEKWISLSGFCLMFRAGADGYALYQEFKNSQDTIISY